jgi:esterase/lipase
MKNLYILLITLSLFSINANGQQTASLKMEKVFLDKTDTTSNYYTIIYPTKSPQTGYLLLLSGFGTTANLLQQTDLPKRLALNGIMTIIPTFEDGELSLGVDSLTQQTLNKIFKDVTAKHKLIDQKFYIGGFSLGGSSAIKYAQNATIKPKAVFAIDPPLDLQRFYNSAKRDIRLATDGDSIEESIYMIKRLEKETGGNPTTHLAQYYRMSPYSFTDTTQSEIKKLINVPLRIYTEPDINWWLKYRGADFTSMNAPECSAMINELNKLGNQNAALITTQNKGFRKPDLRRNPLSWSIVDNDDLINWLLKE